MYFAMITLPEDTVTEILLRLPVRSLVRFRCVCKNWFALINSSLFKEEHLAYGLARYDHELILVYRRHCYHDYKNVVNCYGDYESLACGEASFNFKANPFSNFATLINGVVCVTQGVGKMGIILCNPALREFRKLSEFKTLPFEYFGLTPSISIDALGLGFDEATEDYVVVKLLSLTKDDGDRDAYTDHKCFVYHVKTDSWTMVEMPPYVTASYFKGGYGLYTPLYFHGSIHWCMAWTPNHCILTFNTTTKVFQEIAFPQDWKDYYMCYEHPHLLKVDNSCISLVVIYSTTRGAYTRVEALDVWMMKEYGVRESWTKQYSISCLSLIKKPLSFWRKYKLLLLRVDGKIICYDLCKGEVCQPAGQCDSICPPSSLADLDLETLQVVTCCESLVSIKPSLN